MSLGFFVYEIYGIRRCAHLIVAGRHLETQMNVHGQFRYRPSGLDGFGLLPQRVAKYVSEPFAAGLIYPAVLGAWAFVAALAVPAIAVIAGATAFAGSWYAAYRFNRWLHDIDLPNLDGELTLQTGAAPAL